MESLSCHLMWVAAATYCSILAPKSLLATLIGVLGMAHFSLGKYPTYKKKTCCRNMGFLFANYIYINVRYLFRNITTNKNRCC